MSDLPKSWQSVPITDVLALNVNGKPFQQGWSPQCETHPAAEDAWGVLKTTAIQPGIFWDQENKALPSTLGARPHLEVRPGDLLMTCAGPRSRCGVVCLVERTRHRLMMSGKMYRFRPHPDAMAPRFLAYFIQSRNAQLAIDAMKTGISDSGLNLTHDRFSTLRVPVPPSHEQRRIVDKIEELFSELDKGVENLATAREQLRVYRQSVLKHAFEGKLTAEWRAQNPRKIETPDAIRAWLRGARERARAEGVTSWQVALSEWTKEGGNTTKPPKPRDPKPVTALSADEADDLPNLPKGWLWERLGWMTLGVEYGTAAKSAPSGKVAVIRMGNIQNTKIDWADLVYTSDEEEISAYTLNPGDVLFNRTNSPELVGKTAIYRGERPALFAGYLIRVNHNPKVMDGQYLNLFLNSHVARTHGNAVKTDGVNQSNINGEKLSQYPFPYCSIDEQREVVRILDHRLSLVDQADGQIGHELRRAESLRQAILARAFSGGLVQQDASDEPATVLLERVKAEREAAEGKPTPVRKRRTSAA